MSFTSILERLAVLRSPSLIAALALIAGSGLMVAGVNALAGPGWALIASAVPLLLLAFILIRGAQRVAA